MTSCDRLLLGSGFVTMSQCRDSYIICIALVQVVLCMCVFVWLPAFCTVLMLGLYRVTILWQEPSVSLVLRLFSFNAV